MNVEMPANAKAIGRAASYGDLSENSEYKFALEERDLLRARLARVNQDLSIARMMTLDEVDTSQVSIFSTVELTPTDGGPAVRIHIVSPWDSNAAERRFNYKAPMSQAVLGKHVGDVIRMAFDGGPENNYSIAAILPLEPAAPP